MTRRTRHRSHLTEAIERSIVQWNLRGFRENYEELVLLSKQYKQETLLTNSKLPRFSGFNNLNKKSLNDRALFIENSYLFTEVQLNTPLQAVAARVTMSKAVTVCNIYIPPSVDVSLSDLEQLIQQLPAPFVLVGDFNAHSPLWGDVRQDSRGQMLEKLLDDYNLCLLNTGDPTYRHHSHHSFSVPDLSICDPFLILSEEVITFQSSKLPLTKMKLLLNTGGSTGLTGCPSALYVRRDSLTSWPCRRTQWLSLQIL